MTTPTSRRLAAATLATALLGLTACANGPNAGSDSGTGSGRSAKPDGASTIEIQDNTGPVTVPVRPKRLVVTDNRLFQTLDDWKVPLAAAPIPLIPQSISYKNDKSVVDLGNHREPNLEAVVGVQPDLIINGQRFAQYADNFAKLVPESAVITLDPREGQPFNAELKRQIEVLGQVLDQAQDAKRLNTAFDTAIARVKAAYQPNQTVMAVITSGGKVNYTAPGTGRTLGPVYDVLGLTPALSQEGTTDHQGDDISVEAIAASNPDWILVMDRDAAVSAPSDGAYVPANQLLANSAALQETTAVKAGHIVYMPQDTYINESIQTYTTFFNDLAAAMERG